MYFYFIHKYPIWVSYELNFVHPNSHVETLTYNMIAFGNRVFQEAIKVIWGHKSGILIQSNRYPSKRRKRHHRCVWQRKDLGRTQWAGGHLQVQERYLRRSQPYWQPLKLWENINSVFKPPNLWHFPAN